MAEQLLHHASASREELAPPAEFIAVCVLTFLTGVSATAYFCRSMGGGMAMPGGWTMSMMWMRMPGQTWLASTAGFLLMWLAMMVAMMMPSALPTFLKARRSWTALCALASGYFAVWLAAGGAIYVLGVAMATAEMQSAWLSRAVPLLSAASLIAAGAFQFTRWKVSYLSRCRSSLACAVSCPAGQASFWLGCKHGAACCSCCAAPMAVQLTVGIMNPLAMLLVATVIAAEKLLPQPALVARIAGLAAIFAGVAYLGADLLRPS